MKAYLVAAAAVTAVLAASPALAAKICNISIKSPVAGAEVSVGIPPTFRWTSEPPGTDSRAVTVVGAKSSSETASRYRLHWADMLKKGDYSWFVTFTDKDGKVICKSPTIHFTVTDPKPGHDTNAIFNEAANRNFASTGITGYILNNGRLVIVLKGSSYTGPYWKLVDGSNYDGSAENLAAALAIGLEIHDNAGNNIIIGGPGSDYIYSEGGNDNIDPKKGADIVEFTRLAGTSFVNLVDGAPVDTLTVHITGGVGSVAGIADFGDVVNVVP